MPSGKITFRFFAEQQKPLVIKQHLSVLVLHCTPYSAGGSPGVMGAGGLREAGYLKGVGAGRNGKNFATLAQYFAIGKVCGGGSCYRSFSLSRHKKINSRAFNEKNQGHEML